MDALTLDLISTVLASLGLIACAGAAIWVLPWKEEDWAPRPQPLRRDRLPNIPLPTPPLLDTPLPQVGMLEESAGR